MAEEDAPKLVLIPLELWQDIRDVLRARLFVHDEIDHQVQGVLQRLESAR